VVFLTSPAPLRPSPFRGSRVERKGPKATPALAPLLSSMSWPEQRVIEGYFLDYRPSLVLPELGLNMTDQGFTIYPSMDLPGDCAGNRRPATKVGQYWTRSLQGNCSASQFGPAMTVITGVACTLNPRPLSSLDQRKSGTVRHMGCSG
jgi:hypothetical protein